MSKPKAFPLRARPLLGHVQDKVLAGALGISARSVYRERIALGISRASRVGQIDKRKQALLGQLRSEAMDRHASQGGAGLPAAAEPLLGVIPDRELAKALGTQQLLIARERGFRGIIQPSPRGQPPAHARRALAALRS